MLSKLSTNSWRHLCIWCKFLPILHFEFDISLAIPGWVCKMSTGQWLRLLLGQIRNTWLSPELSSSWRRSMLSWINKCSYTCADSQLLSQSWSKHATQVFVISHYPINANNWQNAVVKCKKEHKSIYYILKKVNLCTLSINILHQTNYSQSTVCCDQKELCHVLEILVCEMVDTGGSKRCKTWLGLGSIWCSKFWYSLIQRSIGHTR